MANNAGMSIFIAFVAGFATVLGALLSLLMTKHMRPLTFAGALAFAAGCTLTVAFADVLPEGQEAWNEALISSDTDNPEAKEEMHASLGLLIVLAGWLFASAFDKILHTCLDAYDHSQNSAAGHHHVGVCAHDHAHDHTHSDDVSDIERGQPMYQGSSLAMGSPAFGEHSDHLHAPSESNTGEEDSRICSTIGTFLLRLVVKKSSLTAHEQKVLDYQFRADAKKISRLGYFTACVLALHNVPEGIALYGTLMVNEKSGIGLAVAISLHNLPQGMAIAVPIYIGHNSKTQAIIFSAAAALAQPLGGLIGYGIVGTDPSPKVMSVMLLLTSGVLFNASLRELYASAVRYDCGNQLSGSFAFLGMLVLSLTLIAIAYM